MNFEEAKEAAVKETKISGNTKIIFMIFDNVDLFNPTFSFCDAEIFEKEIENDLALLPIAETSQERGFNLLPFALF